MQRFTNTMNICSANDIQFATALVADTAVGGCVPGETVAVSLTANLELTGQNTRWDLGVFVSDDGSPINQTIANGGPAVCEAMPIQGDWNADPMGMGPLAITDNIPDGSDGDVCSESISPANSTLVSGITLNYPGGPTFDDPVTIACIAGPGGTLEISAMIVWDNSNPGVCDGTTVDGYPNDKNRCNFTTGEVPVDVLGRVTIIKSAAGAGTLPFEFTYTVDNEPVNAMGVNPTDPFFLQDGQSVEIFGEIGTTGSASVMVAEQNLPMGWALSNIMCMDDNLQPVTINLAGGFVTIPLVYDAMDPENSQSDVTCTFTNVEASTNLTLRKEWVDGVANDTADLMTDGVNDGNNTSTASGAAGSEIDNTNTVVTVATPGEMVTFSETLGVGNTGSYTTGFACTGNTNAPIYNPGATSAVLLIDAADTDVVCTYTNTLQTSSLTLRKQWIDGVMDDTAALMTDGFNDGNNTSTASGAPGSEIDNTNTVVTTALAGETVTLSEMLGVGNIGVYDISFSCTGSANAPTYTQGATTATLLIDAADTDIVCTYSNTVQAAGLTLRKEWVDGILNDTADLMTDGVNDGNNTSTSGGAKGSEVDNVNTVVTTALVGETVTMSEMLGGGNTGLYTTSFACTGAANDPTYTPGDTSATLLIDASDIKVVCTFTNTLQSAGLTLRKEWVDGALGDTAGLMTSGFEVGNSTSMASGAPGSEVDNTNTVVTTALVGETVTLSEMLGGSNIGSYDVSFTCTGNTNAPMYTPGDTSGTLLIDGADTDILCTYTNTRVTSSLTLRKEWVDAFADDTSDLDTDGVNDGNSTSTATGAAGSEIDNVNTVVTTALSGETVTLSEMLGGGNFGAYDASFACTGNANAPTYTAGDTSATLVIDGADTDIVCTYTNTVVPAEIDLAKNITSFDDSVPGTVVVTYEITATNNSDSGGFYDLIDTIDPATGAVIVSAELVSYNPGSENSQTGTLAGALPYSFTSGELLVDDESLAGQSNEGWTVVVEFDVSAVSGEFECNGPGTGTYNEVSGSDTDPNPGNNADCGDLERPRTTFVVTKDFSDDNPLGVTVTLDCNTGLPLQQMGVVHDPEASGLEPGDFTVIEFVINDFLPGTMNCEILETIPAGYLPTYTAGATTGVAADIYPTDGGPDGCFYDGIEGGQFTCQIFNDLQPVDIVVEKEWFDENPQFALPTIVEVLLECDGPIIGGFPCLGPFDGNGDGNYCADAFIDPDNPGVFPILPHFEGTNCFAVEELITGVLTDQSDCESMTVFPGQGDSCVIVNTRLYEGIPTLSQYGLILLALMMFGIGAVAYRRFV